MKQKTIDLLEKVLNVDKRDVSVETFTESDVKKLIEFLALVLWCTSNLSQVSCSSALWAYINTARSLLDMAVLHVDELKG